MVLTEMHYQVLFWVFIGFFLVIGVIALLAIVGVIKTQKQFLKWAIGSFVVGIAGVIFTWAGAKPSLQSLHFYVNLKPPKGEDAGSFEIKKGTYEYWDSKDPESSSQHSGSVELTEGQEIGWWRAKFPYNGRPVSVKLNFTDNKGRLWSVRPFYPNYINKELIETHALRKEKSIFLSRLILASEAFAQQKIRFSNYAKIIRRLRGKTYYRWRVFVDEPDKVLNRIAEVQYLLLPTFPKPLYVKINRSEKFAVEATGWSEFRIQVLIRFKDRSIVKTHYDLDFSKKWP